MHDHASHMSRCNTFGRALELETEVSETDEFAQHYSTQSQTVKTALL